jgi:glucose-6-phosphate-specific signal transduction histidine kinase
MQTSMTIPPTPVHAGTANPLRRALLAPFELRTWKETLHLLLNMPVGIATFTIIITGLALGGSGLAGLRDRVGALDGELHLLSPAGGPTVLMVEIPCAS